MGCRWSAAAANITISDLFEHGPFKLLKESNTGYKPTKDWPPSGGKMN